VYKRQIYVETDKHFLTRILHNLIGNSIKYRDDDKDHRIVCVLAEASNGHLILTVADNGIGIPEKLILHGDIYRPFFQANNHRREQERGVGLGLSIVRAMVDLLPNHRLDVQSHIGVATEFTLSVPLSETSALSPSVLGSLAALNSQNGHLSADVRGLYVLYVEDDDHVRQSTCALLASCGVLFDAASDYAGAHEIIANLERRPDVLVTDLRLPDGRSGLDVVGALREQFEGVPTIVISAEAGFQTRLPADCVALEKPVSPGRLLDVLAQVAAM
jgi:CheY-like chemotaxis protein